MYYLLFRDKKETLAQNYRRLGLVARLRSSTGGVEKRLHGSHSSAGAARTHQAAAADPFAISTAVESAVVSEARVERDADGRIVRIIGRHGDHPLGDPLAALDSDDEEENELGGGGAAAATELVRALEEQSRHPAEKKPRQASERERAWLDELVAKHGDDVRAMARDAKLNPMQQTAADIKRRIARMQKA